jgi:hypothetical protein
VAPVRVAVQVIDEYRLCRVSPDGAGGIEAAPLLGKRHAIAPVCFGEGLDGVFAVGLVDGPLDVIARGPGVWFVADT